MSEEDPLNSINNNLYIFCTTAELTRKSQDKRIEGVPSSGS